MEEVEDMVFVEQLNSFVHQWMELGNIFDNIPDIPNLRLLQILPPACIAIALTTGIETALSKPFWSLTATGVVWACLSLISALLSSAGFYLPYWMKGSLSDGTPVSFGSFRRCNYPRLSAEGRLEMVHECGRYTSFLDIPSTSWQVATVTVGLGAAVALLVAFTALSACCLADVITKTTARILGLIQLVAALLIATGCCIYPNGWSSREIRDVCGPESEAYRLGSCQLSWSLYLLSGGVGLLLLCVLLSLQASRVKPHSFRI